MKKILSLFTMIFTACSNPQYDVKEKSLHEFIIKDIDGKEFKLETLKGKTVLVVNVASKCGLTKQYTDLQKLYENYKDKNFVIIGFPANDFMGQEPGTNEEIKTFCATKYNVNFPMMAKISVKGDDIAPIYQFLVSDPNHGGKIKWNFDKFLVDKDGKIIQRFGPRTKPLDKKITKAITDTF